MAERTDKVTFKGNPVRLSGTEVNVGEKAPDFTVLRPPFEGVKLSDQRGKVVFLSVAPSVDTPVCDAQLRHLNKSAADISANVAVWNLSNDTPFALRRFCAAAGIDRAEALSDFRDGEFGQKYGMLMADMGLLARSLWIIDGEGTIRYKQVVPEMSSEPDYDDALKALRNLVG